MPRPSSAAISAASASIRARMASSFACSGERMSTVKTARPGITLRELGQTLACPTAPTASGWWSMAIAVDHLDDPRHAEARVDAHRHRRRAGMRLAPGQPHLQPPEALAVGDDADVPALGLEDRALLDVELEHGVDPARARPSRRPASRSGRARRRSACPRRRARSIGVVLLVHAGEDARGQHGGGEARPLLVGPVRHARWGAACGCRGRSASAPPPAPTARPARRRTCRPWAGCRGGCRCRPAAPPGPRPRRSANMVPIASTPTVQPAASHQRRNSARPSASASVRVWRLLPPATPGPIFGHLHQAVPEPAAVDPEVLPGCGHGRSSVSRPGRTLRPGAAERNP